MAPPVKPFRTDITAEHLRMKAAMLSKPSEIDKYKTLADLYDGTIRLDDLDKQRRKTAVRWLNELYFFNGGPVKLLEVRKPGPAVFIPSDRSAEQFRKLAEDALGAYQRRLLGIAVLVETKDVAAAAKVAGVEPEHFLKVLSRYRKYGLKGLSAETSKIDKARLAELTDAAQRPWHRALARTVKALHALSARGATFREVAGRFNIPEGTFADNVARFNLGGMMEFDTRAVKIARDLKNDEHATLLRRAADDYAHDLETANRCRALADHYDGVTADDIDVKYKFKQQPMAKIRRAYERDGLFTVIGDTAFLRKGDDYATGLRRLSGTGEETMKARLLRAASLYHGGLRLANCAKQTDVDKLELKRLLARIKDISGESLGEDSIGD